MKKTLKILILTLIISFGFITGLKAETKTLECKYRRIYKGNANSEYNFDFTIKYTYDLNKKKVNYSIPSTTFETGGYEFNLYDPYHSDITAYLSRYYEKISWGGCPDDIYTSNTIVDGTKQRVNVRPLLDTEYLNPEYWSKASVIDSSEGNENIQESDKEKVCMYGVSSLPLTKNNSDKYNKKDLEKLVVYEFKITSTSGNNLYIYDQKSRKKSKVEENSAHCNKGNQAWCAHMSGKKNFILSNGDVESFKNTFDFNKEGCPSEIYLEKNIDQYLFKTTKNSESIVLKNNYSVKDDEVLNKLKIDLGFFKDLTISPEVSGCLAYVGQDLAEMLQTIYTIIKVVSIILTIVLSMVDFLSVLTKDKDELMNTVKKWTRRLIIVIAILLLPTFIDIIGNIAGKEDILCGIR